MTERRNLEDLKPRLAPGMRLPHTADPFVLHHRLDGTPESAVSRFYFQMDPPVAVDLIEELHRRPRGKELHLGHKRACARLGLRYLLLLETDITDPGAERLGVARTTPPRTTPYSESEFG